MNKPLDHTPRSIDRWEENTKLPVVVVFQKVETRGDFVAVF